jgi:hypothetical protein
MTNIDPKHAKEFADSEIADDIAALNFRSWNPEDENDLDEVFTLLIPEPKHNNNGTLSGTSQQELAAILRSGGWVFEGYRGICIKPNNPRKDKDEKEKEIKYESPRGSGNLQLFIPRVSWGVGRKIAAKVDAVVEAKYLERMDALSNNPSDEDCGFWEWFLTTELPIVITEGCKKACSLISAGYPAIALNGIWGWGTNNRDMFGNVSIDDRGKSIKTLHPDLEPFLDGRELVLAFDRDEKSETVRKVEAAKTALLRAIEIDEIPTTQLNWRTPKGIDDYIVAKGSKGLDRIYTNRKEVKPPKPQKEERVTSGDTLLEIGRTATYFHTADKVAYADIQIEGNRHTYAVRSKTFRLWLTGEFLSQTGKGIGSQTLQDSLNTFEAIAICQSEERTVHLRTAEHQGKIYVDLGTPDWQAVEVDATGWRLITQPPVRFWRSDSLLPLPYPVEGGELKELRELINVDDASWVLIITFLLFCFTPSSTYPILVLSAHRGSGKTTAGEIIKGLIDPGKAPLIKLSGDTRTLAVAASRRLVMAYDNVGHITPEQSDDLCRIATGFGYSTRTLNTTDEETTFEFSRPQIITAIDALVTRDDLADRVLMAQLGEISEEKRLPHSELQQKIANAKPRILGALLTALSQTLAELPNTNPDRLPRMADYAKFAIASEKALGLKTGKFIETFDTSREKVREIVIEASPVGEAIVRLMDKTPLVWKGTASELLEKLEECTDEATYRSRYFPKASNSLSRQLNRLAPDLKALGIEVGYFREGQDRNRLICLEKVVKISSISSIPSVDDTKSSQGRGLKADDTRTISNVTDDIADGITNTDDTRTITSSDIVHAENVAEQGFQTMADDMDDKNSLSSSLKVGDRVRTTKTNRIGTIAESRTKKTPRGSEYIQYRIDFGSDSQWLEDVAFALEVV